MFFLSLSVAFVAFPPKQNSILNKYGSVVKVYSSGSLGYRYDSQNCLPTSPNYTVSYERQFEWCSNIGSDSEDKVWISFNIPHKSFKIYSYSIRNGCCDYYCCCDPSTGRDIDYYCCCGLYKFTLQGSNDNKTWKSIHKYENERYLRFCEVKAFEIEKHQTFSFLRLLMDEGRPGCPRCMQINQIEFYGDVISSYSSFEDDEIDNDESISIIGKIKSTV